MMRDWLSPFKLLVAFALACSYSLSSAQLEAEPGVGDPRLRVFPYDANNSYRIFSRPLMVTHLVLEADERVKALALGDTGSWETSKRDNHVFLKPRRPNLETSGTLLTSKREYQLYLISTGDGGKWYQRVSWVYPGVMQLVDSDDDKSEVDAQSVVRQPEARQVRPAEDVSTQTEGVDLRAINTDYEIEGDAPFRPLSVFDNGKRTEIRMPATERLPVLFLVVDGAFENLEYHWDEKSSAFEIPRVAGVIALVLGNREVRIYNKKRMERSVMRGWKAKEVSSGR